MMKWLRTAAARWQNWLDTRDHAMTARQHTVMAWSLLALGRGLLYTPIFPGYGDFPLPLRTLFSEDRVWISGAIWLCIAVVGIVYAIQPQLPLWLTRGWWTVLVMGVAGWGALYCSSIFLTPHHDPTTFKLVMAGELYLAVAYAIAFTRGEEPEPTAWRRRRDRNSSGGH